MALSRQKMKIKEVHTKHDWKLFHRVPHRVYQNDPNWICPLEGDIESIFDPAKNKTLEHGEAQLFVLLDEEGEPAGRLAAFVDEEYSSHQPYPTGGMGYFECVDNDAYAAALFETAENWLIARGMKAADGPANFGGRDKYYGLLVKGFDPPLFQENYQPRYYQRFFEAQGYLPFEQILTMKGGTREINLDRMGAVVERMKSRYDIRAEAYDSKKLSTYAEDFCTIYNAAFRHFVHFKPITPDVIVKMMKEAQAIADPDLLCIVYFEDQPAGFCAFFPDINPILKPVKGRLSWWKIPGFLWRLKTAKTLNCKGVGFGIHPDYKTKGIFAVITHYMAKPRVLDRYPDMYLTTVRAHNKEAVRIYLKLGVHIDRVHIAYRKALDGGIEIEPYEFMEV
jgi:GNAT superfamily N-acetyltransferase